MPAVNLDLSIEQGATFRKLFTWKTGTPAAVVNLTGYSARMQLRQTPTQSGNPMLNLTDVASADGQIILGGTAGTFEVLITAAKTDTLSGGGVYDLELVAPNGDVIRMLQGKFAVSPNVTR